MTATLEETGRAQIRAIEERIAELEDRIAKPKYIMGAGTETWQAWLDELARLKRDLIPLECYREAT